MAREAFLAEARTLATLNHAAIVPIYDFGRMNDGYGSCFLVEKFMPGGTLSDWIESNQVSRRSQIEAIARIAEALSHAHEKGLGASRTSSQSNLLMGFRRPGLRRRFRTGHS